MRLSFIAGLFGLLVLTAGCSSPPATPARVYDGTPTQEELNAKAKQFQDNPQPKGTVPGGQVPLKFINTEGKEVDLASYRGTSNVVLVVVKGLPKAFNGLFCPGCLAQVNSLTANYTKFKEKDAEIVMVFPGPKDALPQFLEKGKVNGEGGNLKVPFTMLMDTDLKAVKTLGIDADWATPSTYILDKKGNAVFVYVGEPGTTTDRPSVQALLAQLDKLNAQK
jgi:peroxiredoxin